MTPATAERTLKIILRFEGALLALAAIAVFLPFETMATLHREVLGMGELPDRPIVDYLARSLSFFYAAQAPLYFLAAANLERLRPLVVYLCWFHVALGVVVLGIDLRAGLPPLWTWGEGPPTVAIGLVNLWLLARVPKRADDRRSAD
jgi:hypothetical protein